jgi:nucleotide-binding universal stress UspA family protein
MTSTVRSWHLACAYPLRGDVMPRTVSPQVFRSILCPVDFSTNSRGALRYAAMLARLSNAHLFILYVDDPLLATVAATRPDAAAVLAATDAALHRFVAAALASPAPPPSTTLLTIAGKPSQEIIDAAERHDCDLIVVGYRGAGRTSRLLFGSTTEGVVRTASVPVLAVPPPRRRARLPIARRHLRRAS